MAEVKSRIKAADIRFEAKLTEQQKKLLKELAEQYKKQSRKKKEKLRKILIPLLIFLTVAFFIYAYFHPVQGYLAADDRLSVHYIDVGQGDSVFLAADGETMLIDCGEDHETDKVISYLEELGVRKLDYVICTHPHSDHMGGMYKVIGSFETGEVIIPHLDDEDIPTSRYFERFLDACEENGCRLEEAEAGRIISLGDARAEVIAPLSSSYSSINDYSVSLFITHGKRSFIFTGDAEKYSENEMAMSGRLRHADVYKAGHHGSDTSSSPGFLEVISPSVAVISCGEGNSYGHPCDITLERIAEYTDKVYRTDLCGTIVIESDGEELAVRTERNS